MIRTLPVMLLLAAAAFSEQAWKPAELPLVTRWAKQVTPENVHPEYPRPQMVRPDWLNLNGLWDYAICPRQDPAPSKFEGKILVPFPVESALSGVARPVTPEQRLWYRRTFRLPPQWQNRRILLHFGAVDWQATVWVNGHELGTHRGGYDPFSFDITECLNPLGDQEILVAVWDPTDAGMQPRGKQVRQPEGIWYTSTTGIWQTVWLEPVPPSRIERLQVTPDVDSGGVHISVETSLVPVFRGTHMLEAEVLVADEQIARTESQTGQMQLRLQLPQPHLWSPDDPFLYDLRVRLVFVDGAERRVIDEVASYFGMRKVSLGTDERGRQRILLNNRPLFMLGLLDQGFWPDGLYTAPSDEALRYDIEITRKLGFNLARKHVKVEPQRWYYWAERLGLLVFQDIPSGDAFAASDQTEIDRSPESAAQFELELERIVQALQNHPCVVMWVLFNEGWGQYDTRRLAEKLRQLDPHRLVDAASGWHDVRVGDVVDIHSYPGPQAPPPETSRASVLGEFGGLGLVIKEHSWQPDKSWGYRTFKTPQELTDAYLRLIDSLRLVAAESGLSAAVYTQTTDVEIETNGLLTYDRALAKVDETKVAAANRRLYLPLPQVRVILPTSEQTGQRWRYTLERPAENWTAPDFSDGHWSEGPGGFGRNGTPGITVRTDWTGSDIWLRRRFELKAVPESPYLRLYHDEDCEVYLNGQQVAEVSGYVTAYVYLPISDPTVLRPGQNVLAIHCRQTGGGQGVDAGIVELVEQGED